MTIRQNAKRRKQIASRKAAIRGLNPMAMEKRQQLDLTNLTEQAYIQWQGHTYLVEGISHYQEYNWKLTKKKNYQSFELDLFCLNNAEQSYIEWEKDDRIEASKTLKEIKMSQLRDEENVDIDSGDLEQIVDEEDSVYLNGKEFEYDDDWAAKYYRDKDASGVNVRFYEFVASDGQCLTIEEWLDGEPNDKDTDFEYEVFLSEPFDPDEVEVLALKSA